MSDARTEIRIGIPLQLDVVAALTNAIGAMWPDAAVRTDDRDYVILIPSRKAKRVAQRTLREFVAEALPGDDAPEVKLARITGPDSADFALEAKEEAWQALGAWAWICLTAEAAPNYVEQQITGIDPEGNERRMTITAAWTAEQTPHALHAQAKAEIERLSAELAALRKDQARD